MTRFLLDASVALAWFVDQPTPVYALDVMKALVSGGRALVPAIWHLEVANGLAVAERRKLLSAEDLSTYLMRLEQLFAQSIEMHNDFVSMRQALSTARLLQLSAYDAVYLDAARNKGVPLASLDKSLRAAATRVGVPLFN